MCFCLYWNTLIWKCCHTGDFVRAILIPIPHHELNALNLLPPGLWAWQRFWGSAFPLQGGDPQRRSLSRRSHLQRQGECGVVQIWLVWDTTGTLLIWNITACEYDISGFIFPLKYWIQKKVMLFLLLLMTLMGSSTLLNQLWSPWGVVYQATHLRCIFNIGLEIHTWATRTCFLSSMSGEGCLTSNSAMLLCSYWVLGPGAEELGRIFLLVTECSYLLMH